MCTTSKQEKVSLLCKKIIIVLIRGDNVKSQMLLIFYLVAKLILADNYSVN